jgi:hypothetical protein
MLVHGTPGSVLHGAVLVRNVTGHPVTVDLQPAEIQDASNGNADYSTTHFGQAGAWLRLSASRVVLPTHASRHIGFTVVVPAGAVGASHYAGIVAFDAADMANPAVRKTTKRGSFTFYRINRQALPITIRLPGPLTRGLALHSAKLIVSPTGAGLVLGLRADGSELIESARIKLRILRGAHTVFRYASTLGQLFPGASLSYRVPWPGSPVPGSYSVVGVVRPVGAPAVNINQTVTYTAKNAVHYRRVTTPGPPAPQPKSIIPAWMWAALAIGALAMLALAATVVRMRRPSTGAPVS